MQMSLLEILRAIPDRRRAEGKRFDLATVLLYAILRFQPNLSAEGSSRRMIGGDLTPQKNMIHGLLRT